MPLFTGNYPIFHSFGNWAGFRHVTVVIVSQ